MLGTLLVILGVLAMGAILGGWVVWRQYRHHPTNDQIKFLNAIYKHKAEDYKALCHDALSNAEAVSLIAQSIHLSQPSEASAKIVSEIDKWILVLNERASAKQLTPAEGIRI